MKAEDIKLTVEEKEELELQAKEQAKVITKHEDIEVNCETVQWVIDRANKLIQINPHLTYDSIEFDVCTCYDCSDEVTLKYTTQGDWKPIYKRLYKNKLLRKQRDYASYIKLKEQFGDK